MTIKHDSELVCLLITENEFMEFCRNGDKVTQAVGLCVEKLLYSSEEFGDFQDFRKQFLGNEPLNDVVELDMVKVLWSSRVFMEVIREASIDEYGEIATVKMIHDISCMYNHELRVRASALFDDCADVARSPCFSSEWKDVYLCIAIYIIGKVRSAYKMFLIHTNYREKEFKRIKK